MAEQISRFHAHIHFHWSWINICGNSLLIFTQRILCSREQLHYISRFNAFWHLHIFLRPLSSFLVDYYLPAIHRLLCCLLFCSLVARPFWKIGIFCFYMSSRIEFCLEIDSYIYRKDNISSALYMFNSLYVLPQDGQSLSSFPSCISPFIITVGHLF